MAGGNVPSNLAPLFQQAGAQYGIPPEVLAGVASVETNLGQNRSTSSAGAQGLMQFMPGTARGLGVNPYDDHSSIFGAAKLLTQYGYHQNPLRAIGAYNGGPGNPQFSYASQVMSEAARLKGQVAGGGFNANLGSGHDPGFSQGKIGNPNVDPGFTLNQAAFKQAQGKALLGQFVAQSAKSPFDLPGPKAKGLAGNSLFSSGLLTTKTPNPADYMTQAATALQHLTPGAFVAPHPNAVGQSAPSGLAGGFLPQGSKYVVGRKDQGRDGTTNPGGPVIAPGDGYVVRIGSNPSGFGPNYPIVAFTSGPYKGQTMYIGHTHAAITSGQFKAGQTLSYTGTSGVGNATVPGWFEIGFASGGTPGPMGQKVPF